MSSESDSGSKSRASGSRSRGGCHTCKIRRVKCDETKPGCIRCQKFGRVCDGYEPQDSSASQSLPTVTTTVSATLNRKLLPLDSSFTRLSSFLPTSILYEDEQEERYFNIFRTETACALAGGLESSIWTKIVLQACNHEPCILHCAVAISALDKAQKIRAPKDPEAIYEDHHRYALQHYGKALNGLQEVISRGNNATRTALIASILIFCFENFHGDFRLALTNVQIAVELMHNWLARNTRPGGTTGLSPAPDIIEDELVSVFARMEIVISNWIDTVQLPGARARILRSALKQTVPVPLAFKDLNEATASLNCLNYHAFGDWQPSAELKQGGSSSVSSISPTETAGEIKRWSSAFEPLLHQARMTDVGEMFVAAGTVKANSILFGLAARSAAENLDVTNAQAFDVFLPEYCEVVALCQEVVAHPRFIRGFCFYSGIISALFHVITQCRDRLVREKAVKILKEASPRREGCWDSLVVARIGEELLRIGNESSEEVHVRKWVERDLQCLSTTFELPRAKPDDIDSDQPEPFRYRGRISLLDWVVRYMQGHDAICGSTDYYDADTRSRSS